MEGKKLTLLGSICLILIFAVIPFMTACPAQPEEPTVEEPAAEKSVLRVAWVETPPGGINPFLCNSATDWGWNSLIYEPLWIPTLGGEPVPWLAKSWEYKEDEKAWIIYLDEGATWSDGEPVTAEDVKFTFETCLEYTFTVGSPLKPYLDSIMAVGDYTVRFNFAEDYAFFVREVGDVFIVPEHIWSEIDNVPEFRNPNPIGSGPFLFQEFVIRQHLHVVKSPNYWRGPVSVDEVLYKIYTNPDALAMAFLKGEIDALPTIEQTLTVIPLFEVDPDIQYMELTGSMSLHLFPNHRTYPLNLKEVRQAISLVVDREAIVDAVLDGHGYLPLMGLLPPCYEYYADTDLTWPGLDMTEEERIAEANAILDDLGFKPGPDGVRVTDKGTRMEFRLVVPSWPAFVRGSEVIKDNLAPIGIAINILPGDAGTVYGSIVYSGERTEDWDFLGPTNSYVRGLKWYCSEWAPTAPNPWMNATAMGFEDEELQPLLQRIAKTVNVEQRKELMTQAQELFAELLPTIALCHKNEVYAYRTDRFTGWDNTHTALGNLTYPDVSLLTLTSLRPK